MEEDIGELEENKGGLGTRTKIYIPAQQSQPPRHKSSQQQHSDPPYASPKPPQTQQSAPQPQYITPLTSILLLHARTRSTIPQNPSPYPHIPSIEHSAPKSKQPQPSPHHTSIEIK